jgi:hypothetical protein
VTLARGILQPEARAARLGSADGLLAAEMLLALIRATVVNQQERDDREASVAFVVDMFLNGLRGAVRRTGSRGTPRPQRRAAGGGS